MKRPGRALFLATLSAATAEFLLGDQWLSGPMPLGQQGFEFILYVMFYGGAANLIRHATRHYGRGWPSVLLYALAFGIFEEGIVDQSLFNPAFAGTKLLAYGSVPGLGISAPWTVFVLSLHVIWSITTPIAIAEAAFEPVSPRPPHGHLPASWLSPGGVIGWTIAVVVSAVAIFSFTVGASGFMASPLQLTLSAALTVIVALVAARLPRRSHAQGRHAFASATISLGVLSCYYALFQNRDLVPPWLCMTMMVVLLGALAAVSLFFRLDSFGLAVGALVTYAWVGLESALPLGWGPVAEQLVIIAAVAAAVAATALRRKRRFRTRRGHLVTATTGTEPGDHRGGPK